MSTHALSAHAIDRARHPVHELRRTLPRPWRVVGSVAVVVLGAAVAYVAGFGAYGFVVGASDYLAQVPEVVACHTPGTRFGWTYEAINYDPADDARLVSFTPNLADCGWQGEPAGDDVVSADGTGIAGWYIPAGSGMRPNGPTVVLVHGGKANKSGMLDYADALHRQYNLVILDLRNSGRSGGTESTGGLQERFDLRAMIDWLVEEKHPAWIALLGNSNGAATALAEAIDDPRIRALVLDSMHATIERQLASVAATELHVPAWPGVPATILGVSMRLGEDVTSLDPVRTIVRIGGRPVLLTHGTDDEIDRPAESLDVNLAAALDAGIDVRVERCEGAGHGQVVATCGDAWADWVGDFLSEARAGR
jgi:pimeloyl-ACP methyl ester carboxylesterase